MAYNSGFPADGVDDQGWKLYITALIMVIAAGLFVVWRSAARLSSRQFGSDDYTIIASLAFSIVLSICINLAVVNGYGKHKADLSKQQLSQALEWFFIAQAPYKVTVCLYKISVLLFYKRIFITRPFQIACWSILALIVVWGLIVIFLTIFQCWPIAAAWNGMSATATCIDSDQFWIAFAVSNILTDAIVLALPIPSIMRLNLNIRERILLLGVFLLGGFVIVTGILRTTSVANSLDNRSDITYNFIPRGIWTLVEANVGIICACLPILKNPISRVFLKVFGGKWSTKQSSNHELGSGDRQRGHSSKKTSFSWSPRQGSGNRTAQPFEVDSDEAPVISRFSRFSDGDLASKASADELEKGASTHYTREL